MTRPRKLDAEVAVVLQSRVFIARTTDIISQREVADGFDIGIQTLRRYTSEKEREYSRELATRQHRKYRKPTQCEHCKKTFKTHARCQDCDVLIHRIDTEANGGSFDMKRCYSCERAIIRKYGLAGRSDTTPRDPAETEREDGHGLL